MPFLPNFCKTGIFPKNLAIVNVDINIKGNDGYTAVDVAKRFNHPECLEEMGRALHEKREVDKGLFNDLRQSQMG